MDRLYSYEKELHELRTPQVLNPTKEGLVVKYVDSDGNINIRVVRYGDPFSTASDEELENLNKMQEVFKDMPGEMSARMYTYLIGRERWPAVAEMIAREAVMNGSAARVIDPALYEQITQQAMDAMAARRIVENTDEFAEEFPKVLAQYLMPIIHRGLTDPQMLQRMQMEGIVGASVLYEYLMANQPKPGPIPTIQGGRSTYGGPR